MKKYILCLGLAIITAGTARAEDAPQPFPTRDVTVRYQDHGGPDPASYVMHFSVPLKKLRMEIDGQPDYNIMDVGAKRNIIVMGSDHAYMEMAPKPGQTRALLPDGTKLVRAGEDTVAGLKCTVWNETGSPGGTVCVSEDGVLLRSHYNDGKNETTEATAVKYEPQPASLFEVPAGYEKMEIPVGLPGGMKMPEGMKLPNGMQMPAMPALPADTGDQ